MANLTLKKAKKTFPNGVEAVKDFTMEIKDKEFKDHRGVEKQQHYE